MSAAQKNQTETGDLPAHVEAELETSNSSRLRRVVRKIWNRSQDAKQTKEISIDVHYNDSDLTSVTVESVEAEKTATSESVHFVLGPRGGLRTARFYGFGSDHDYADRTNAWWYLRQRFDRMR